MEKCTFYAICAKGLGDEDGFYKVKAENFGEYKDISNAENNAKIQNETLKNRLIKKVREDCKALRAIYEKNKVDVTLYFEDGAGKIQHMWFERNEVEQYGAIKALMITGKAFVVADFVATKYPFIRFCQGFESEWLDRYEPKAEQ